MLDNIFYKENNPQNLLDKLNFHYQNSINSKENYSSSIVYKYKELPAYVRNLIDRKLQEDLSWFEYEFRYQLDSLSGIVIIDAR